MTDELPPSTTSDFIRILDYSREHRNGEQHERPEQNRH
jgi:hypothetical protein